PPPTSPTFYCLTISQQPACPILLPHPANPHCLFL
ncbi:unnamed protein product, partial [Allacma fusca]